MLRKIYFTLLAATVFAIAPGHQALAQGYNSDYIIPVYDDDDDYDDDYRRGKESWTRLGCKWLDFRDNRYVMKIGRDRGRFRRLRLNFDNRHFKLSVVRVVFGNGDSKRVRIQDEDFLSRHTVALRISGGKRYIQRIVMRFRSGNRNSRSNVVCIDGGQHGEGRRSVAIMPKKKDQWVQLGCFKVRRKTGHKSVGVGKAKGRFKALRIHVTRRSAKIKDYTVVFGNGKKRGIGGQKVSRNGYSRVSTFRHSRFINSVQVNARGRDIFKKSQICVQGLRRG